MAMLPKKLNEEDLRIYERVSKNVKKLCFVINNKDGFYYTRDPIPVDDAAVKEMGLSRWLETKKNCFIKLNAAVPVNETAGREIGLSNWHEKKEDYFTKLNAPNSRKAEYKLYMMGVDDDPEIWFWDRIVEYLETGKITNPKIIRFLFVLLCNFYFNYACAKNWGVYYGTE